MIRKDISSIMLSDIQQLLGGQIREGKTIDYKRDFNLTSDRDKGEFLADISSFANTSGGDLIIGVREESGIPVELTGVTIENIDDTKLKIDAILRDGIEPRLTVDIQPIRLREEDDSYILVLRVQKSWRPPHRIVFSSFQKTRHEFYARGTAGKYQLDLEELRASFDLSGSLAETVREFHKKRLFHIISGDTPIPLPSGGKIILHIFPLESFSPGFLANIDPIIDRSIHMRPFFASGWSHRLNLEGFATYSGGEAPDSYVQLWRSGLIEMVDSSMLERRNDHSVFSGRVYEEELRKSLGQYLRLLQQVSINPPLFVFLSIINIKGYSFHYNAPNRILNDVGTMERENILLPEVYVPTYVMDVDEIMRPLFDMVWNAWGYRRSFNYDQGGVWTAPSF